MKHLGDITKISGHDIPIVDVITGGSPCQDLSVAGKRAGLEGERSGLFMEQVRIVKEMRERDRRDNRRPGLMVRPRYMVWENVTGALNSADGEDFRCVLEEITRICDSTATIPRPADRWTNAGVIMGDGWSLAWRVHDAQYWGVPQRRRRLALVADFGGESAPEILFERKGLPRDIEQGEEKRERTPEASRGSTGAASYTMRDRGGVERDSKGRGAGKGPLIQEEKSGTLSASQDQTLFCPEAACIGNGQAKQIRMDDKTYALDCMHDQQAIIQAAYKKTAHPQHADEGQGWVEATVSDTLNCFDRGETRTPTLAVQSLTVRRLTPLECERLQGFPDGWTDIGDWADSNGKKHKAADAPRYRALGNSIAIPFWMWLLGRISERYDRPATLGSLFDGIGGFPYCWEKFNGKGSALWASEIEEFPIAVTKARFPDDIKISI